MDIMEDFVWHSSIGIDCAIDGKRFKTRIANNSRAASMFIAGGNDLLIHKTTRCLWKMSEDKKFIEPVFSNDVLTDDDLSTMQETQP